MNPIGVATSTPVRGPTTYLAVMLSVEVLHYEFLNAFLNLFNLSQILNIFTANNVKHLFVDICDLM
jgi:hypothetical protein